MSKIRPSNTKPEIALRKELFNAGLRYRLNYRIFGYRADIAFPRKKVAVLVDGCFWHKSPKCYRAPKSNLKYWLPKISANIKRDKKVTHTLIKNGWRVIRIWEHSLKENTERCVRRVIHALA